MALQLVAIFGAIQANPKFLPDLLANPSLAIGGGIGYLFLAAMTATSFDRTTRWLGPKRWQLLHSTGMYYLWFIFMFTYAVRARQSPVFLSMAIVFGLALIFKLTVKRFR